MLNNLRDIFLEEVDKLCGKETDVAVTLSSGIDSNATMFALLELKKNVTAYSFHIEGVNSTDFVGAKANAKIFGVKFVECIIPKKIDVQLIYDFMKLSNRKKKTEVECFYPYYFLLPKIEQKVLLLGLASDLYFCLSKKGKIHYAKSIDTLKIFRDDLINVTRKDVITLNEITQSLGKDFKVADPFEQQSVFDYFYNKNWKEINTPHQKQPILDMFPEYYSKINVYNHTNLQCGDSMIRETFEQLLSNKEINHRGRNRMLDLYKDMYDSVHNKETKLEL